MQKEPTRREGGGSIAVSTGMSFPRLARRVRILCALTWPADDGSTAPRRSIRLRHAGKVNYQEVEMRARESGSSSAMSYPEEGEDEEALCDASEASSPFTASLEETAVGGPSQVVEGVLFNGRPVLKGEVFHVFDKPYNTPKGTLCSEDGVA